MRKTKIVCTLGPASEKKEIMKKLFEAGLNVARFNFSHGDYEEHGARLKTVRELNAELGTHVATMLDTKGPEIRTNEFDGKVEIKKGSEVRIAFKEVMGTATKFSVTYPGLYDDVKVGDTILVDDGYLELTIIAKDAKNKELVTNAVNTHVLKSRRGINVPNVVLNMPFISTKDKADIEFAAKMDYDFVAASFVRRASDILEIKEILKKAKNENIQVIAKIENQEGVDNLDEIIEVADGIMVARGDLGVEIPAWKVPEAQTLMIQGCLEQGKVVIVATQMLESMQKNPRPTRAEVSDVYNAVMEGTSATMLSGESAAGDYPVESVTYMAQIDTQAELEMDFSDYVNIPEVADEVSDALAINACITASNFEIEAIVAYGIENAVSLSKYHPSVPVVAVVDNEKEARRLALNFAIFPVVSSEEKIKKIKELKVSKGDFIITVAGSTLSVEEYV